MNFGLTGAACLSCGCHSTFSGSVSEATNVRGCAKYKTRVCARPRVWIIARVTGPRPWRWLRIPLRRGPAASPARPPPVCGAAVRLPDLLRILCGPARCGAAAGCRCCSLLACAAAARLPILCGPAWLLLDLPGLRIASGCPGSFPAWLLLGWLQSVYFISGQDTARPGEDLPAARLLPIRLLPIRRRCCWPALLPSSCCGSRAARPTATRFPAAGAAPGTLLPPEVERLSETIYAPVLYNLEGYNITRARVYIIQDIYYRARKGVPFRLCRCGSPAVRLLGLPELRILPGSPMGPGYFSLQRSEAQRAAFFPAYALCACIYQIAAENARFRRFARFCWFCTMHVNVLCLFR